MTKFLAKKFFKKDVHFINNMLLLDSLVKIFNNTLQYLAKKNYKYPLYLHAHRQLVKSNTVEDIIEASFWLEKSVERGNLKAAYKLGVILEQFDYAFVELAADKTSYEAHNKRILNYYIAAAEAGLAGAQYKLGLAYWLGKYNLPQDNNLSHDWFTLAARQLHPKALGNIAIMYYKGEIGEVNYQKAYQYFKIAHELGDHQASCNLAQMYGLGEFVAKNLNTMFNYYYQAAHGGFVDGMYNLARCFEKGQGVIKNSKEAFAWYTKAAAQGCIEAKLRLADYYVYGKEVKANPIKAEYLLKSVAELGNAEAQFKLATFYDTTSSNLRNYEKAYHWYLQSAKQGNTKSQINLAALFLKGEGTQKSDASAQFWLEMAVSNGDQIAKYNLQQLKLANMDDFIAVTMGLVDKVVH